MHIAIIALLAISAQNRESSDPWLVRARACRSWLESARLIESCSSASEVVHLRAVFARLCNVDQPRRHDAIGFAFTGYLTLLASSAKLAFKMTPEDARYTSAKSATKLLMEATSNNDAVTLSALVPRYFSARLSREPDLAQPELRLIRNQYTTDRNGKRLKVPIYETVSDKPLDARLSQLALKANKIDSNSPEARCLQGMQQKDLRKGWLAIRKATEDSPTSIWRYFAVTSLAWRASELKDDSLKRATREASKKIFGENRSPLMVKLSKWEEYLNW